MPRLLPNGNIAVISHVENTTESVYAGVRVVYEPGTPEYERSIDWLSEEDAARASELQAKKQERLASA